MKRRILIVVLLTFSFQCVATDFCRLSLARYGTTSEFLAEIDRHARNRAQVLSNGGDVVFLYPIELLDEVQPQNPGYTPGVDDEMVQLVTERSRGLWRTGRSMFTFLLLNGGWTYMMHLIRDDPRPEVFYLRWSVTIMAGLFTLASGVNFTRYYRMPLVPTLARQIDSQRVAFGVAENTRHTAALVLVQDNQITALTRAMYARGWEWGPPDLEEIDDETRPVPRPALPSSTDIAPGEPGQIIERR